MLPAVGWLLFTTILLLLPGSSLPQPEWQTYIPLDKIVHIFFLGIMVWLICRGFYYSGRPASELKWIFFFVALSVIFYGIAMEFAQKYFTVNRFFDGGDIIADAIGAALGFFASYILYIRRQD